VLEKFLAKKECRRTLLASLRGTTSLHVGERIPSETPLQGMTGAKAYSEHLPCQRAQGLGACPEVTNIEKMTYAIKLNINMH